MDKIKGIFSKPFWREPKTLIGIWMAVAVISAVMKIGRCNNYLIFKYTFWHMVEGKNLYALYPEEYGDCNHYGPLFSMVIAPFAVMPDWLGLIFWHVALAGLLYWAVRQTGWKWRQQLFLLWFGVHELLTALFMSQFNIAIAAILILAYAFIEQGKEKWATLAIMVGTLVKLYGIVGLAFFFFARDKKKFVIWMAVWSVVLFCMPMIIAGPEYVLSQYQEWYLSLTEKNSANLFASHQNISLLGMVRKVGYCLHMGDADAFRAMINSDVPPTEICLWTRYSDLWLIVPGLIMFCLPYLRLKEWKNEVFRRMFLASTLMFVCLFSTGTESSSYIIALMGVSIWYTSVEWERGRWATALMVLVFVLTSLSPTDIIPPYLRYEWIWPFALKSLPVTLCWGWLVWEMMFRQYDGTNIRT